jgi:hypothetical protein
MAIDINNEKLIPFNCPKDFWPVSPAPHVSQVHRWRLTGLLSRNGIRVKLESVMVGGRRFVSKEAVSRFIAALNDDVSKTPTPDARARSAREAGRALEAIGA